jgi:hypothetical protein
MNSKVLVLPAMAILLLGAPHLSVQAWNSHGASRFSSKARSPSLVRVSAAAKANDVCTRATAYVATQPFTYVAAQPFGLTQVTVLSATNVWLVGSSNSTVTHWNGLRWQIVKIPPAVLYSISAVSPNDIWAVGSVRDARLGVYGKRTVTEHWDGRRWRVVPDIQEPNAALSSVVAISRNDVWAVGNGIQRPVIEHWNGKAWTLLPLATKEQQLVREHLAVDFYTVAAASPSAIWIGGWEDEDGPVVSIDRWDGTRWQSVPSPRIGGSELHGLAPISPTDVWAVGRIGSPALRTPPQGLTEHWDGKHWRIVPDVQGGDLSSGAAASATDEWAVGSVVERWNGTAWHRVPTAPSDHFGGVAVAGQHDIWAVGSRTIDLSRGIYKPVVVHFTGPGC